MPELRGAELAGTKEVKLQLVPHNDSYTPVLEKKEHLNVPQVG